ncbi:cyanophycinase [Undibacterium sp. Di24W]|uniref:cyanophycinase n=1 Tax=Undibacterium sp. Di24W TaxID=3413033 RepID=UPI003BF14D63
MFGSNFLNKYLNRQFERSSAIGSFTLCVLSLSACSTNQESKHVVLSSNQNVTQTNYGDVSNVIIGGGMRSCSSMGSKEFMQEANSRYCLQGWSKILREDIAFTGLKASDVSFEPAITHPAFSYRIDASSIEKIRALSEQLMAKQIKDKVIAKLIQVREAKPETALSGMSWKALVDLLASQDISPAIQLKNELSTLAHSALRHSLVEPLETATQPRLLQARSVKFLSDRSSSAIYQTFLEATQRKADQKQPGSKPKIGIVTASAENPFNDRDISYYAFKSLGADVVWLPIEGGLRQAIDQQLCEFAPIFYADYANRGSLRDYSHMDLLYPDLAAQQIAFCKNNASALNQELMKLDGIFFTGGNQTRHLESFITKQAMYSVSSSDGVSEQLRLLRKQYAEGRLVVAGSSAGDAVQSGGQWRGRPVPMIGGGDSVKVLRHGYGQIDGPEPEAPGAKGSFAKNGGLGFFRFGVLDSHFSQRAREARLVRLVADSGVDYGFGVDENTALVVHASAADGSHHMRVVGAGGVFVVDARQAKLQSEKLAAFKIENIMIHYLNQGDSLTMTQAGDLQVQLSSDSKKSSQPMMKQAITAERIQDSGSFRFLKLIQKMGEDGADKGIGSTGREQNSDASEFALTIRRTSDSELRINTEGNLSYARLRLDIAPYPSNGVVIDNTLR